MFSTNSVRLGDVGFARTAEWRGAIARASEIVPEAPERMWRDNVPWLSPHLHDSPTGVHRADTPTWVIRSSESRTILAGTGNDEERACPPARGCPDTGFRDNLAAGTRPEQ
ncbi:hypothetical protein ABTZ58_39395 [Streptomyces sp. NPDC094143]|uniref:hypothetical protein n=1 Tax=Streptomyces sp. NPDC094143 TaxID=3155310 RepID=UPI00332F987E